MRRIQQMAAVVAVAFAAHGFGVGEATAQSGTGVVPHHPSAAPKSKHRRRDARVQLPKPRPVETTKAPTQPVFLSDAWLKQEKLTDDKLRRFMEICKGC